jgi:hypothetical protein
MPYIINKTNGSRITILDDAALSKTTSLTFVGRNFSGYGEIINENFLKLLESFSNTTQPITPITGQLWFDTSLDVKKLNVYDGLAFKGIASLIVSSSPPTNVTEGDLWWDNNNQQLKLYSGFEYKIIGPAPSTRAAWEVGEEQIDEAQLITTPVIQGTFGGDAIVLVSNEPDFNPVAQSALYEKFPVVKKGITLYGAKEDTGSSKEFGYYFWGTAADALVATTSTSFSINYTTTNATFHVPFANTSTGFPQMYSNDGITFNPSSGVLTTIASSSRYADLAERYKSDNPYDMGSVLIIGGSQEVTETHRRADTSVIGIVSCNPAFRMNEITDDESRNPYIALRGRVPCKVIGPIKKGTMLVTSSYPGYAEAFRSGDDPNAVFARALYDFNGNKGLVEVVV